MTSSIRAEIQSLKALAEYWQKKAAAHRKAAASNAASAARCARKSHQLSTKASRMEEANNDPMQ